MPDSDAEYDELITIDLDQVGCRGNTKILLFFCLLGWLPGQHENFVIIILVCQVDCRNVIISGRVHDDRCETFRHIAADVSLVSFCLLLVFHFSGLSDKEEEPRASSAVSYFSVETCFERTFYSGPVQSVLGNSRER